MNSFELNKILGAILFACLCLLSLNLAANAIFAPVKPEKPGYEIAVEEKAAPGEKAPAAQQDQPIETLFADRRCQAWRDGRQEMPSLSYLRKRRSEPRWPKPLGHCRTPARHEAGFNYSAAMKAKSGDWSIDDLYAFLKSPKGFLPGTAMGFAGISKATERADVIDYLNTLADSPKPLPTAQK